MQQKQTQSSWFNLKFLCAHTIFFPSSADQTLKWENPFPQTWRMFHNTVQQTLLDYMKDIFYSK